MEIEWTDPALDDLEDIRDYIAKDSPHYARCFAEQILDVVEKLSEFPKLGREVPEAGDRGDIRELLYQNYRVIYLAEEHRIKILTVIHGGRDLSRLESKSWDIV